MSKRKAFTLVELLVVIAIIALLMSILMPSLGRVRALAQRIVCGSHMKDLMLGNEIYSNNWDGYYVPCMDGGKTGPNGEVAGGNSGATPIVPAWGSWMMNDDFRDIIGYEGAKTKIEFDEMVTVTPAKFTCPSDIITKRAKEDDYKASFGTLVSYGYNATEWYGHKEGTEYGLLDIWGITEPKVYVGHRVSKIRRASQKLAFIDGNDWYSHWWGADYTSAWDELGQDTSAAYMAAGVIGATQYRHGEGANIAFYDSHVSYMKKADVFVNDPTANNNIGKGWAATPKEPGMWVADYSAIFKGQEYPLNRNDYK